MNKRILYMDWNWHNVMDCIEESRLRGEHSEFFKVYQEEDGEDIDESGVIHKIEIVYSDKEGMYELYINDFNMGDGYENMGEIWEVCKIYCIDEE